MAEPWQEEFIPHYSLSSFHPVLPNLVGPPSSPLSVLPLGPQDTILWGHHTSYLVFSVFCPVVVALRNHHLLSSLMSEPRYSVWAIAPAGLRNCVDQRVPLSFSHASMATGR